MDKYLALAKGAVETYIKESKIISPPPSLPRKMKKKAGVFVSIYKLESQEDLRGLPRRLALAPVRLWQNARIPTFRRDKLRPREQVRVLRGCIGTFLPTTENIAAEIVRNAIASATGDPRFLPVATEELPDLVYSVDILSTPKPTPWPYHLSPKKYGLIVSAPDGRRGLLLPNLPDVKTPEEQFQICCLKGGINLVEKVTLQCFTVERHAEK